MITQNRCYQTKIADAAFKKPRPRSYIRHFRLKFDENDEQGKEHKRLDESECDDHKRLNRSGCTGIACSTFSGA
jgi:hypothetical protein